MKRDREDAGLSEVDGEVDTSKNFAQAAIKRLIQME